VLPSSMCSIRPSVPITKVDLFAMPRSLMRTPYASAVVRMKSLSIGYDSFNSSAQWLNTAGWLVLTSNTWAPCSAKFSIPAWYPVASFVQPPVKAAGKNPSTTGCFPR